jgi:hypothetical protein
MLELMYNSSKVQEGCTETVVFSLSVREMAYIGLVNTQVAPQLVTLTLYSVTISDIGLPMEVLYTRSEISIRI